MNPAENYIFNQPEPFKSMLLHVRAIIEHALPDAALKYKWKIPCFYVGRVPLCYLNVSQKKGYLDIGFWHSAHLTAHVDKMVSENRKVVRSLRYSSLEEIDDAVLRAVLREAYTVQKDGFYKKRTKID